MEVITNSKEDYLRVLYEELKNKNMVQSKDLANTLNISRPSVSRMMAILKKSGYIEMEKYGSIKLTQKGESCAKEVEKRRNVLYVFLTDIIGLDKISANNEVCRIEHAISLKTAEKLEGLIDMLSQCVKDNQSKGYKKILLRRYNTMPRGDGTGPMGMGSMTGRGAGICAGYATPGYVNPIGYGCGFGGGRGFKRNFYATGLPMYRFGTANINGAYSSKADEKELLKRYAQNLESQLKDVKKRISDFDNGEE